MTYIQTKQPKPMGFLDIVWNYKISLAVYIVAISFMTFIALYSFGGVPDELKVIDETQAQTTSVSSSDTTNTKTSDMPATSIPAASGTASAASQQGELPVHITISKIGVNTVINNPTSTNNDTLNAVLLKGAIRYPGSGTLGHGNMFVLAHSTGIKIVNNQAYKAFNHLNNLNIGDTIKVQSSSKEYTYSVTSVSLIDSDAALINLSSNKNMLTLSTCDVFGEKQQRFVVEASFVSSADL